MRLALGAPALALALALAAAPGCQSLNTPIYFTGNGPLEATGMASNGMQERVKDGITLRFRNPTTKERMELDARRNAAMPVKVPWLARDNLHIQITFTVKNLDATAGVFDVLVDGANEFIKYDEDVVAAALGAGNNNQAVYLPLMQSRPQMLGAGQTYQGLLREDDFAEAESDLNAIDQFMAPFASVLINRSDVNPVGLEMVPPGVVVPAMVEVDVTFTANKHMTCEYLVRVRDDQDQLLHDTGDTRFALNPTVFQPTLPP